MDLQGVDLFQIPISQSQPTYVGNYLTPIRIQHGSPQQLPEPLPPHEFLIQSLPQSQTQFMLQPSQIQSLPPPQFLIRPLSLSSARPFSPDQNVPLSQFQPKSKPEPLIKSLSEQPKSLPQTLSLPQSLPQPSYHIQSLPPPQFLIRPPTQTQFLPQPSYHIQSLPSVQFPSRPLSRPPAQNVLFPQSLSKSDSQSLSKSLSEPEPQIKSISEPELFIKYLFESDLESEPESEPEPESLIKSLSEPNHQIRSLPQPSSQTQFLPQPSYHIQSLPPPQFLIRPPTQTQFLPQPSYHIQSLPSAQFPIRPFSRPPAQFLSSAQAHSPAQNLPFPQFLSKSDSQSLSKSLSEPEPQIKSISEPELFIKYLFESDPESDPESEPELEPESLIKSLSEPNHQIRSLPQPSSQTQFLPQPSYHIQSLPPPQFLIRPPTQTQFLPQPSYHIQSLPSAQFPIRPFSRPPAQFLSSAQAHSPAQNLPFPQFLSKSDSQSLSKSLSEPEPQIKSISEPELFIKYLFESDPESDPESEPELEPESLIKSLSEPNHQIQSLPQPSSQTQFLPQPSYHIQSLPPPQFLIRPPTQTQFLPQPSYHIQSLPSAQFPIRPFSRPPAQFLSSAQAHSPAQNLPFPQFLSKSDSQSLSKSLSEPEPQIKSISEPELFIKYLFESDPESDPESEPELEPESLIKSLSEPNHQIQSLPQPSSQTQFLPQPSYHIQSLPPPQFLIRPPTQTQFLPQPSYHIQSLPSAQFPIRPFSRPPAQFLSSAQAHSPAQNLPFPQFLSKSDSQSLSKSLSEPEPQIKSISEPELFIKYLFESDPESDPESEPELEPESLIKSLSEPNHQIQSLPQPSSQTQFLPQPSYHIQSLPPPQFLIRPPTQTQFLPQPSYHIQSLPSAQFPIRPFSRPPAQFLSSAQAHSPAQNLPFPQFLSKSDSQSLSKSLSEPEPQIKSISEPELFIKYLFESDPESDPESEPELEPESLIKSLSEPNHQIRSLPQPSSQTQFLPQPSYHIQSLPPPQFLIRPPTQTQFLPQPSYHIQSLPSAQFPIRPFSRPPAQFLSSAQAHSPAQNLPFPQFLSKSDSQSLSKSLSEPEPQIKSISEPELFIKYLFESDPESDPESEPELEPESLIKSLSEPNHQIQSLPQPSSQTQSLPQPSYHIQSLPPPQFLIRPPTQTQFLPQPSYHIQSLPSAQFPIKPFSQPPAQFLSSAQAHSPAQNLPFPQFLSKSDSQSLSKSLSEPEPQIKSLSEPELFIKYLFEPESEPEPQPEYLIKSPSELKPQTQSLPSHHIQSLPSRQILIRPPTQTQFLPQPSYHIQSLPPPQFLIRLPNQTQFQPQPSYHIQSLPSAQLPIRPLSQPPAQFLSSAQSHSPALNVPFPQFLSKSDSQFLSKPEPQIKSLSEPKPQIQSLPQPSFQTQNVPLPQFLPKSDPESLIQPEPESWIKSPTDPQPLKKSQPKYLLMAQMMNSQVNDQGKSHGNGNNSSNSKYYKRWMVQSEESLQKQHAAFHKASFGQVLFCCFTLDSEWFFYLEEIGLPIKACRDELRNSLTYEDLDCMLIIEDIVTTLIHLTKDNTYLVKMLDAIEKLEKTLLKDEDILVSYVLEKAHPFQVVQQTWKEAFVQSDVSEQKKFLTLFLMKLYQQHINDFNNSVDSWEKIRNLSVHGTYIADALQKKGEEQLTNGNLENALGCFNEAIDNCPLDVNSYKQRAKIHELLKNYKLSSCDLIRVHVLEPDWEEGYILHEKILKNLDEQWTTFYFKMIDKWTAGAHSYRPIKTVVEDMSTRENICTSSSLKNEEKNIEEKTPSVLNASDNHIKKAMDLYKQQKFKEMLQLFKVNILETTLYQLALLSLIHLKQFNDARQLASTAIQTFTDDRQFSGDKEEVVNLKKMFNFVKSLPSTPFGQCEICKTGQQSSVADIYLYNDSSMLDDIFHKGCIVLTCENRCRILFHFECLSGSNDFVWKKSSLKNYIRTLCSTPDCQSLIIVAEAFSVNNTKPVKVVDNDIGFKKPEISNKTEISRINLTAQNFKEQNNNSLGILSSADEATLPSDTFESSAHDMGYLLKKSQAAMLNKKTEPKPLPSYKEYEGKKTGKNKKRAEKKVSSTENMEFGQGHINLNPNLTNGLQPETNKKEEFKQSFSESAEEIENDHLLLYLCSVLHTHGQLSASGEIFQNEIKALSDYHKQLLSKSGGLASFLLQSNNVLLKDPDILFLEADTLTTVIPVAEDLPLQSSLPQASAIHEDFASSTLPTHSLLNEMSAAGNDSKEQQCATSGRDNQLKRSVGNSDFEFALLAAFGPEFTAEQLKVPAIHPENASVRASSRENELKRSDLSEIFKMGNASSDEEEFERSKRNALDPELEAQTRDLLSRDPRGASAPPKSPRGFPNSEEELQNRNSPPDKEEINILDLSTSEFDTSSSSSEQEQTEEDNDFFSYSDEHSTPESSDSDFCEFCSRKCKPRIAYLEEESRKLSVLYNNERRYHEIADKKISSLEAKLKALEEENLLLKRILEDGEADTAGTDAGAAGIDAAATQSREAIKLGIAALPKSTLRSDRRSVPSHLKSFKQSSQSHPWKNEEGDINLCVICHDDIFLMTINTLQCGHVFHDKCIRKWFQQQKTCPSCRKHTLLTEDFPPLV